MMLWLSIKETFCIIFFVKISRKLLDSTAQVSTCLLVKKCNALCHFGSGFNFSFNCTIVSFLKKNFDDFFNDLYFFAVAKMKSLSRRMIRSLVWIKMNQNRLKSPKNCLKSFKNRLKSSKNRPISHQNRLKSHKNRLKHLLFGQQLSKKFNSTTPVLVRVLTKLNSVTRKNS